MNGIQEVGGSTPPGSTNPRKLEVGNLKPETLVRLAQRGAGRPADAAGGPEAPVRSDRVGVPARCGDGESIDAGLRVHHDLMEANAELGSLRVEHCVKGQAGAKRSEWGVMRCR